LGKLGTTRSHESKVVTGNRILVLLSKETLVDQDIDVRGQGVAVLALKHRDGPCVLFSTEDQFCLALATRHSRIDGHYCAQHDGHDRHGDQ
jgi:hypothetical protein